jgi:hypothetical protein
MVNDDSNSNEILTNLSIPFGSILIEEPSAPVELYPLSIPVAQLVDNHNIPIAQVL